MKTYAVESMSGTNDNITSRYTPESFNTGEIVIALKTSGELEKLVRQIHLPDIDILLAKLGAQTGKKSFLVYKHNKYVSIPTENIAMFYLKYETAMIMCFDGQEYTVNYSLEQIQSLLPEKQFFRLNRQYLINFRAVKEVEHYFARKLLVHPVINAKDKLLVSKEKVTDFLHWLDNR